jgi:DNA-binding transcriptional regulator YiaG
MVGNKHQIKSARKKAGLTQREAASLVYCTVRAWQMWEAGDRVMHASTWELFLIKTKNRQITNG